MSLLLVKEEPEFQSLIEEVCRRQFESAGKFVEYQGKNKEIIHEDIEYNIDFLYTAMSLGDSKIFETYAKWLYQLLCPLMDCPENRVKTLVVHHLNVITESVKKLFSGERKKILERLIENAIHAVEECEGDSQDQLYTSGQYEKAVSYTHLDVYKRQAQFSLNFWGKRPETKAAVF